MLKMQAQNCDDASDDENSMTQDLTHKHEHLECLRGAVQGAPGAVPIDAPNVPQAIWSEFKVHFLKRVMQRAVQKEKFEKAGRLQHEIESLNSGLMLAFESTLLLQVASLRARMQKCELHKLQLDLEMAVAAEDYESAENTQRVIQQTENRTPAFSGFKYFEWAWLESDLDRRLYWKNFQKSWMESAIETRVTVLRSRHLLQLQDEVYRLEHLLWQDIQLENYENAARIRDELDAEKMRRESICMWSQLERQVMSMQRHMECLQAHPDKFLEYKYKEAVQKEDYETAAQFCAQLSVMNQESLLGRLEKELQGVMAVVVGDEGNVLALQDRWLLVIEIAIAIGR